MTRPRNFETVALTELRSRDSDNFVKRVHRQIHDNPGLFEALVDRVVIAVEPFLYSEADALSDIRTLRSRSRVIVDHGDDKKGPITGGYFFLDEHGEPKGFGINDSLISLNRVRLPYPGIVAEKVAQSGHPGIYSGGFATTGSPEDLGEVYRTLREEYPLNQRGWTIESQKPGLDTVKVIDEAGFARMSVGRYFAEYAPEILRPIPNQMALMQTYYQDSIFTVDQVARLFRQPLQ